MSETLDQWRAGLTLGFAPGHAGRTVLRERAHYGPMLVQRALYPEGPQVCHVAILHPPSGIAGGDALEIRVDVAGGARAALTTPGATRWYKSNGRQASQDVHLRVAAGAGSIGCPSRAFSSKRPMPWRAIGSSLSRARPPSAGT